MEYKFNYDVPDAQVLFEEKKRKWIKAQGNKKVEKPVIPTYDSPVPQSRQETVEKLRGAIDCLERIYVEDDFFGRDVAVHTRKQQAIVVQSAGLNELKAYKSYQKKFEYPKEGNFICANGLTINFAKESVAKNVRESYKQQFEEIAFSKQRKNKKTLISGIVIAVLAYIMLFVSLLVFGYLTDYKEYFTVPNSVWSILSVIYIIAPFIGIAFVIIFNLFLRKKADAEYEAQFKAIEATIIKQIKSEQVKINREFVDALKKVDRENLKVDETNRQVSDENNRIFAYNNEVMKRNLPENQRRAEIAWKQFMDYEAEKSKSRQYYIDLLIEYQRNFSWIPEAFASIFILRKMLEYFEKGLVDNFKEASIYYENDIKHQNILQQMRANVQAQIQHNEKWNRRFEQNQKRSEELAKKERESLFETEMRINAFNHMINSFENRRNMFDAAEYARTGYRPMF